MKFVLITRLGKVMTFYVQDVAIMYRNIYGGSICVEDSFENVNVELINEKA